MNFKIKLRIPVWTRQLPINLNNNQNLVQSKIKIRDQNQIQSHEFDEKTEKTNQKT